MRRDSYSQKAVTSKRFSPFTTSKARTPCRAFKLKGTHHHSGVKSERCHALGCLVYSLIDGHNNIVYYETKEKNKVRDLSIAALSLRLHNSLKGSHQLIDLELTAYS